MKPADVETNRPSLLAALVPVLVLIGLLGVNVYLFGEDSSYGPNQIALLLAAATAAIAGVCFKTPFKKMLEGVEKAIGSALTAMLILLLIGSLAGTWMMSGIVPTMIYYGLDILNPKIFLFASAVVCAIVSVATGSSWSTVATVGIALLGIGSALGVSEALAAGAIISGAYFGDKISPLSDTTNLAAAMAGTDLIRHIKYMLWTTIPSFTIALVIYLVIGFSGDATAAVADTSGLKAEMLSHFDTLSPILLIVPLVVFAMVIMKFDAVAALFVGAVLGGVFAIIFQPQMITKVAGLDDVSIVDAETGKVTTEPPSYLKRSYVAFVNSMAFETLGVSDADTEKVNAALDKAKLESARRQTDNLELTLDEFKELESSSEIELAETFPELEERVASNIAAAKLLKGKGMNGMLNTIWLIITAMCFGGIMEACGFLRRITEPLIAISKSNGALVATTTGSCVFVNATASDQYLAIVVPGQMFRETYRERGLAPENLSRTLEDAGTVTSVLIPWNTCGAAQAGVLGVTTWLYAPFCFFNLISPLMTMVVAFFGIGIAQTVGDEKSDKVQK
ncbi:MAG: Na+/H+ antiporter NhaC family protein [Mariniblastus sp.]